jgi:hypothetical protein
VATEAGGIQKLFAGIDRWHRSLPAHPEIIEFGVLRHDGTLWVNQFPNCKDSEEIELMERLFRSKLAGDDDQALRRLL